MERVHLKKKNLWVWEKGDIFREETTNLKKNSNNIPVHKILIKLILR